MNALLQGRVEEVFLSRETACRATKTTALREPYQGAQPCGPRVARAEKHVQLQPLGPRLSYNSTQSTHLLCCFTGLFLSQLAVVDWRRYDSRHPSRSRPFVCIPPALNLSQAPIFWRKYRQCCIVHHLRTYSCLGAQSRMHSLLISISTPNP
jgi:hypothetical protein